MRFSDKKVALRFNIITIFLCRPGERKTTMQTIQARDINLRYLIDNFGIQLVREPDFFPERQRDLSELTDQF